jgi:hypothetical protein
MKAAPERFQKLNVNYKRVRPGSGMIPSTRLGRRLSSSFRLPRFYRRNRPVPVPFLRALARKAFSSSSNEVAAFIFPRETLINKYGDALPAQTLLTAILCEVSLRVDEESMYLARIDTFPWTFYGLSTVILRIKRTLTLILDS